MFTHNACDVRRYIVRSLWASVVFVAKAAVPESGTATRYRRMAHDILDIRLRIVVCTWEIASRRR